MNGFILAFIVQNYLAQYQATSTASSLASHNLHTMPKMWSNQVELVVATPWLFQSVFNWAPRFFTNLIHSISWSHRFKQLSSNSGLKYGSGGWSCYRCLIVVYIVVISFAWWLIKWSPRNDVFKLVETISSQWCFHMKPLEFHFSHCLLLFYWRLDFHAGSNLL